MSRGEVISRTATVAKQGGTRKPVSKEEIYERISEAFRLMDERFLKHGFDSMRHKEAWCIGDHVFATRPDGVRLMVDMFVGGKHTDQPWGFLRCSVIFQKDPYNDVCSRVGLIYDAVTNVWMSNFILVESVGTDASDAAKGLYVEVFHAERMQGESAPFKLEPEERIETLNCLANFMKEVAE